MPVAGLLPSPRFFVVPLAAACVLVALALTRHDPLPAGHAALAAAPAAPQMQACDLRANGPHRVCALPAG